MRINACRLLVLAALFGTIGGAYAQQDPMTFMTTFRAEGSSSRTAQIIAPKLAEYFGRSIGLSFGKGSHGALGIPGDGSTIFISTVGAMALLPSVIDDYDLDPLTDLRPVSLLTETPDVLIVHSSLGINTIDELVAHAQQNPGALTYSYIAPRSIHRVEFSALFAELGIEATPDVSFTGSVAAMEAIGNGDIDLVITTSPYVAPLVDSGAAVALAVAHHERIPLLPGVPTMQEIGVASIPRGSWAGLFVPAGTSDEDVQKAFEAVEYAMSDPDAVRRISELGMVVSLSESPAAFAEFITAEGQRLKSAVERYEIDIE